MQELYVLELLNKDKRIDGRKFDEFRPISIKQGIIKTAEGSAEVTFGETKVMAGVKLDLGVPYLDSPDEGVLTVNAEFTPLASPDFEFGPPGEDAIELARIVDRGIRESKCIELKKLCIEPKEKVWTIFIDLHMINHQGNLLDCSALAAFAALLNTKIPKIEDDEIIRGEFKGKLSIVHKPINITVAKFADKFLLDPNLKEESILNSKLSICVREDDKICALQKQGKEGFSLTDVEKMLDMAIKKSKEIRKLIR